MNECLCNPWVECVGIMCVSLVAIVGMFLRHEKWRDRKDS